MFMGVWPVWEICSFSIIAMKIPLFPPCMGPIMVQVAPIDYCKHGDYWITAPTVNLVMIGSPQLL